MKKIFFKDNGHFNAKSFGIVISIAGIIALICCALIGAAMNASFFTETCKYCIDQFKWIAGIECGGIAAVGAVQSMSNNNGEQNAN